MTFLEQLDRWHEDDEHEKIVDAILALPPEGRGYDLTGRLARALNNLSREAEGLAVLDGVAEEGENDPLWHYRRGYALYYLDREAEAKAEFERAAALDPGDADSREFIRMCDAILEREAAGDSPELYGEAELEALDRFITGRFGPYESVFHELASPDIHVDICVIPPRPERNYYTLVTMGMGAHRMDVPEGLRDRKLERAEMVVCLPPDWPLSDHDERWYWPLRWLKILARLPGEQDTWLGWGHTVSNEEPFADNTGLCAVILDVPRAFGGEAFCCPLPGGDEVNFYQYVPIYQEELDYKLPQRRGPLRPAGGGDGGAGPGAGEYLRGFGRGRGGGPLLPGALRRLLGVVRRAGGDPLRHGGAPGGPRGGGGDRPTRPGGGPHLPGPPLQRGGRP